MRKKEPVLIVQCIIIQWNKLHRGAPGAVLREKTPLSIDVPESMVTFDRAYGTPIQHVSFSSSNNFSEPVNNIVKIAEASKENRIGCCKIR